MSSLTPLQVELVKTFARPMSEKQVLEIKQLLADYFARQLDDAADRLAEEESWPPQLAEQWLSEHNRTSYGERQIVSKYQAVQKKLDQANETLKPFTKEQITEAFEKSRSQKRDEDTDEQVIASIKEGVQQMRLIEQGKMKSTSFDDFLKELDGV